MKKTLIPIMLAFCLTGCSMLDKEPEIIEEATADVSEGMTFQHEAGIVLVEQPKKEGDPAPSGFHNSQPLNPIQVGETETSAPITQPVAPTPKTPAMPVSQDESTPLGSVFNLGQRVLSLQAQESSKNIMISPISIERAMSMAAQGAKDKTWQEILDTVYGEYDYTDALSKSYAGAIKYQAESKQDNETYFVMANSIWANSDNGFEFKEHYKDVLYNNFDADAYSTSFSSQDGVDEVNAWIEQRTRGQINKLFDSSIDGNLVLLNTCAFKDSWMTPFYLDQEPFVFTDAQGKQINAAQMLSSDASYCLLADHQAFVKHYSHHYKFVGILPNENESLADTINSIGYEDLTQLQYEPYDLTLVFPKFQSDYQTSLTNDLKFLGIKKAFTDEADFSDMCDQPVLISDVIHKTHIVVDEDGTEAAAATAIMLKDSAAISEPRERIELYFNRPFYYVILDANNIPLFMGVTTSVTPIK